jgi:hypothetical protein
MQIEGRPGGARILAPVGDAAGGRAARVRSGGAPRPPRRWLASGRAPKASIGLVLCVATAAAHATPCEQVMAPIEARIRAKGVADFRLEAVDLAASAAGVQVGTCDLGRKKILYLRGTPGAARAAAPAGAPASAPGSAPGSAPQSAPQSAPRNVPASGPRVITECADGRVIEQGSCRKK